MNTNRKIGLSIGHQRGASLIELTISLPILLFLMAGTIDLGSAFFRYNKLTYAVQDAARFLTNDGVGGSTGVIVLTQAKIDSAKNLVVYGQTAVGPDPLLPGMTPGDVADPTVVDPDHIRVSATYRHEFLGGLLSNVAAIFGGTAPAQLDLVSTTTMRVP